MVQPGQKARQRTRKITHRVSVHRHAKLLVDIQIAVGVEHVGAQAGARLQTPQGMHGQGLAGENLQAFVHPAHAAAPATGQDQASDGAGGDGQLGAWLGLGIHGRDDSTARPLSHLQARPRQFRLQYQSLLRAKAQEAFVGGAAYGA